ncbi:MAG: polymer-forming cytoskeletal protein [Candidatus Aminicenantes bacterium]|nr:MAG: polymer-forming cytoskeletal protein [Candidatus Aminicenantes bacterium]
MIKQANRGTLDRIYYAPYNQHTMSEPVEKTKTVEAPQEKRPLFSSARLGSTAKLKGEWVCDEDVIIQGHFQGKIDSGDHDLHIEKEAIVKADIQGKNITILGKVTGNVKASGKITIGNEAKMIGDLTAPQINIQEGANFMGTIKMFPKTI